MRAQAFTVTKPSEHCHVDKITKDTGFNLLQGGRAMPVKAVRLFNRIKWFGSTQAVMSRPLESSA